MGIMADFYKAEKEYIEVEIQARKIREKLKGNLKWNKEEIINYQSMKGKKFLKKSI